MDERRDDPGLTLPPGPMVRPTVVTWFVVYCAALALLYLVIVAFGVAGLVVSPEALDMDPVELRLMSSVYVVMGVALLVPFCAAPFLPRRKWVWIVDLVLICLGMTSCCTLPACVPMLIFWMKPDVKAWFGAS